MPKISIIIPTYNSGKDIGRCLESIDKLDSKHLEVVIIDGKSSDNTMLIVNKYRSENAPIIWVSEEDKGVYDAMNKGVKIARGEWIFFLGSDDIILDNKIIKSINEGLISLNNRVIYGNVLIKGDANWANDGECYDGVFNLKKLMEKNICHQAIFYHYSLFKEDKLQFNLNYPVLSDWDFNLQCWSKTTFKYIDTIVAHFYGGGASSNKEIKDPLEDDFVLNVLNYFELSPFSEKSKDLFSGRLFSLNTEKKTKNPFRYYFNRLIEKLNE